MKKIKAILLGLVLCLSMSGCFETFKLTRAATAKIEKEKEIATLVADYDKKLDIKTKEISKTKDDIIASKDGQIKAASDGLYAANLVFQSIPQPIRTDLLINNYVNESWTALGHQMPTYETLLKINERVKKELDEKITSIETLKKTHEQMVAQNTQLADKTKGLENKIAELEKENGRLQGEYTNKLKEKQGELKAVNDKIQELNAQLLNNEKEMNAAKMKISIIAGLLALGAIAGAVYSPIYKDKFAIFGAVCGMISVGIWYLQAWHVATFGAVCAVALIAWAAIKYHKSDKLSDAFTLAMEDAKAHANEAYSKIIPFIEERMKKYVKKNGQIITEEDPSLKKLHEQKLVEWDLK